MIEPLWLVTGIAVPAAIAAAFVGVGAIVGGRILVIAWALGLSLAFAAGCHATAGWPRFPPNVAEAWLLVALLPAAVIISLLSVTPRIPRRAQWTLRVLFALAAPPLLLQVYLRYHWTFTQTLTWLAILSACWLLLWLLLAPLTQPHARSRALSLAFALAAAIAGVTITLSGSLIIGQFMLALAATLAGPAALGLALRRSTPTIATVDVALTLYASLLIIAFFYAELTALNFALLAISPAMLWLSGFGPLRRTGSWRSALSRLIVVALPAAIALTLAAVAFARDSAASVYSAS